MCSSSSSSSSRVYKRTSIAVSSTWLFLTLLCSHTLCHVDSINFRNYNHLSEKQITTSGTGEGDGYSNQGLLGGFFDGYNAYGYHDQGKGYIEEDGGKYLESEETSFRRRPHYKKVEHKPAGTTSATKIEDKYIKITRCDGNRDTLMYAVFPIQDGYAQKCKSHGPNAHCARVTLPTNRHIDMHWHLFANVRAKQECYSPYGQHYYHVDGWVEFDYFRADTIGVGEHSASVGMNYNSTIVQRTYKYMQNCSELADDIPDVERYSVQIMDSIPPFPTDGWTDMYYTSNSTDHDASSCLQLDFRGYVNIPMDTCLNDPAGWMNLVSFHGLTSFFNESEMSNEQLENEPNSTQILSENNSRNDTLYFQYVQCSSDSSRHQCGVQMQYFRHDDDSCEHILKKHWINTAQEGECGSVLEDERKELYTLASGKYSKSVATYPANEHCQGSKNDGFDSGFDIYTFHGPCRVVSCFAGTETVQMESGEIRAISSVGVGDRILSADRSKNYFYADVIAVPHSSNIGDDFYDSEPLRFVVLTTESGHDLKLSEDHMVWASSSGSLTSGCTSFEHWNLVKASMLRLGDCIETNAHPTPITAIHITIETSSGYHTVVTDAEFIVVNGIVTSPFAVNHLLGHRLYYIYRFYYWMIPDVIKSIWFRNIHAGISNMIAEWSAV